MVISFQKSSGAASDMMLAVMTSCFTPAACATSRIRVVPEMAVYDEKGLVFEKLERTGGVQCTKTTNIEDDLGTGGIRERRRDMDDGVDTCDVFSL